MNFSYKFLKIILALVLALEMTQIDAQSIAEKKAGIKGADQDLSPQLQKALIDVNKDLRSAQNELRLVYSEVEQYFAGNAPVDDYLPLLRKINLLREEISSLEEKWREMAVDEGHMDNYALWHQPETTIGQLIMDYGSHDYVYLIPDEIAALTLSVDSNLPIPRASWEDMLETILTQNGIGYNQLNPYLRQLFLLKDNKSRLKLITNNRRDLELLPLDARVSFVLTPEPAEARRTWLFLEKFVNPISTVLQIVGRDILIIGQVAEVQDLLKLNDFITLNKGDKEYRVFPIRRVDVEEMARILAAIFDQDNEETIPKGLLNAKDRVNRPRPPGSPPLPQRAPSSSASSSERIEVNGLRIIPLAHIARALFLVGTREEIAKAEQIIQQVENQVGEARERTIYWYTTKHSDPEELAEVLQRIYLLMITSGVPLYPPGFFPPGGGPGIAPYPPGGPLKIAPLPTAEAIANDILAKERAALPSALYQTSYYQQGNYVVNPAPIEPRRSRPQQVNRNRDNFLVDPKTGSIAMVIEADILPKMKELIKKLDVPKRMVQIEVLLFERRVGKQNNFGLNLLKIGDCASQIDSTCIAFNQPPILNGILDFIISRDKTCGLPAYDIAYRFLMTQNNIQINASPSVVAVNQTPATIAVVEEISINTGIFNVETARGNTLENAFTRTQYGIIIDITPTVHITADENGEDADEPNYVTLETDVTFDTIQGGLAPDRPDVTRRHITNEVRVPDGQTIILGGLRRKNNEEFKEGIPFLGELPALGKLFSFQRLAEHETEMFIFLTPTIISDPLDDFEKIKCEEMRRRPGDIPEFLCALVNARNMEKDLVLVNSMTILLGPEPDRCHTPSYFRPSRCAPRGGIVQEEWLSGYLPPSGEYDGQCE